MRSKACHRERRRFYCRARFEFTIAIRRRTFFFPRACMPRQNFWKGSGFCSFASEVPTAQARNRRRAGASTLHERLNRKGSCSIVVLAWLSLKRPNFGRLITLEKLRFPPFEASHSKLPRANLSVLWDLPVAGSPPFSTF